VYFMDASGVVHSLAPDGTTKPFVTDLASGGDLRAFFAVSPDDTQIAYTTVDYSASSVTTQLYIGPFTPGPQLRYTQVATDALWPVGWHGGDVVLAKVPACPQSGPGGGAFCCGVEEYHLVDPSTAKRLATLGGGSCGAVAGPPSPAGVLCETTEISYNAVNWQAHPTPINEWISGLSSQRTAYLSPGGTEIAVSQDGTATTVITGNSVRIGPFPLVVCGWIDDTHVLSGGNAQAQPRIADTTTQQVVPVAAEGQCAGRIPGGL
jgi:hypothetical protein